MSETLNCKCLICHRFYAYKEGIPEGAISHGICPDTVCQEEYMRLYGPKSTAPPKSNPPYSDEDADLAREIIDAEMGSFQADPRGYVRSAGWDPAKVPGLTEMDLDFSKWDVRFLAGTIAELRGSGMSDAEIMESSEVNDYTSNLIFGKIRTLMQKASRKAWMKSKRGALTAKANPGFRKFRPGDIAVGTGGGGLSPMEGEHVTVVRKIPWRTVEGSYRDPGPRAVYFRRENGEISWTFPQYLHLVEGRSAIERKLEYPAEHLGREFRHLDEQPVDDPQLPGTANPRRKSFDEATALLGYTIADRLFSEKDPQGMISPENREWFGDWAHGRMTELFNRDPKWNRKLRGPRGRDHAYMWVGHWMDAFMKSPEAFKAREHDRKRGLEMKGLGRSVRGPRNVRRNPDPVRWSKLETVTFDEVPVEDWFRAADGREFTKVSGKEAILWNTDERYVFEPGDFVKAWMSYRREKR